MDHILYWNNVALEANRRDFTFETAEGKQAPQQGGPTLSSRALAIVHLAMYDAHAAAVNQPNLPRYLAMPATPAAGMSAAAAVAAAAHVTLSMLFPRQRAHFDAALSNAGLTGAGVSEGMAFGASIGKAMMQDRATDPGAGADGYVPPQGRGYHRADPANPSQGFHAPFYGKNSRCFAVQQRHELNAPPAVGSPEYTKALRQVRSKGIAPELMGTLPSGSNKRTVDETIRGLFWAYDGVRGLGTPPRLYNLVVRAVAQAKGNSVDDNARLFAFVNAAMGDAGILAWEEKYRFEFWRPVVGLREHDGSMGPTAPTPASDINNDCDPTWLPLGGPASNSSERNFTPPFPAYPSGHATFGAAALHVTRLFYGVAAGDRTPDALFPGAFVSEELDGITRDNAGNVRPRHARKFARGLWQMIEENGYSRIDLGVHWSFDAFALRADGTPDLDRNVGGVPLGLAIAEDIFAFGGKKAPRRSEAVPRD